MEVQAQDLAQIEMAALQHGLAASKLQGDQALAFIAEQMRSLTSASAAAIALFESGEIVCRASSGSAPPIGARVDPQSGLSGECVRTGRLVRCEDTEADPRADRLVCRHLDLRSMVIVPVRGDGRPAGLLEVFSSQPNAFQTSHELLLENVAGLVAEIATPQPLPTPPLSPEPGATPAAARPPQADEQPTPALQQTLPLVIEEEVAPSPPATAEAEHIEPPETTVAPPQPAVATAEHAPTSSQSPASEPAELQADTQPTAILSAYTSHESRAGFSSALAAFACLAAQRCSRIAQRLPSWKITVAACGLLLTVLLVAGWQHRRSAVPPISAPSDVKLQQAQPQQVQPAPAPARPAHALVLAAKTATDRDTPEAELESPKPARRARVITLPPPDLAASGGPPVLTQLARSSGDASPISGLLAAPVASPTFAAPRISQISGGKLIRKINPVYPSRAFGVHGKVVLKAMIDRKGRVTQVSVVSGSPLLARAAADSVRRWRYQPFLLNGVPIEMEHQIVINFKAPGQ